jgi:hypothetical protein
MWALMNVVGQGVTAKAEHMRTLMDNEAQRTNVVGLGTTAKVYHAWVSTNVVYWDAIPKA